MSDDLSWFIPKGGISDLIYHLTRRGQVGVLVDKAGRSCCPSLSGHRGSPEDEITIWGVGGEAYPGKNVHWEY